jgi:hypothetical protein
MLQSATDAVLITAAFGIALLLPKFARRYNRWSGWGPHFQRFCIVVGQVLFILAGMKGLLQVSTITTFLSHDIQKKVDNIVSSLLIPMSIFYLALAWVPGKPKKNSRDDDKVPNQKSKDTAGQ